MTPMHSLHAYWRMEYVSAPREEDGDRNPFATMPDEGDDRAVHILHRAECVYIVLNKYPYNPGHMLVVPFRQVGRLRDLTPTERTELTDAIILAEEILEDAFSPDGFNIGLNEGVSGGAGIPEHLHFHVVPRWDADTNFMPVVANTRVLPQSLDATWEKLRTCVEDRLSQHRHA